ncbi:hypothetical protein SOVF_099890, partial [Spinacia oleracea]
MRRQEMRIKKLYYNNQHHNNKEQLSSCQQRGSTMISDGEETK